VGTLERRAREREETRTMILDAARELFVEHGVEAVTMRAIAQRIEYTPTAIYHHFRDKHALLVELCVVDFQQLGHVFQRLGRVTDPVDRLRHFGVSYVEFGLTSPNHYRFMFMTERPPLDEAEAHKRMRPEEDAYSLLRATAAEAIAAGRLRPEHDDADAVAQMLWSAVHGVVALRITKKGESWIEWRDAARTARAVVDTMTRGMLRDPAELAPIPAAA
jgi:AcrR family transcriptional regulator